MRRWLFAAFLALPGWSVAAPGDAQGMRLYRYTDSRGVTVLDTQGVPPEYVSKGYQVLNAQGRVIQTVPPAPTASELQARQAAQAKAQADSELLERYPSLEDLDKEKTRRLADLDNQASLARNRLLLLQQQQGSLQSQAAAIERSSQAVPDALSGQIDSLRRQQAEIGQQLVGLEQQKGSVAASYEQQRVRLEALLSNQ